MTADNNLESSIIILLSFLFVLTVNYLAYDQFLYPSHWISGEVAIAPIPLAVFIDGAIILSLAITGVLTWQRRTA